MKSIEFHRSVLFVPASNARAVEKAGSLPADVLVFDLEDAVAPEAKVDARGALAAALNASDYGPRTVTVRVNSASTAWGKDDIQLFCRHPNVSALVIPKVNIARDAGPGFRVYG